MTIVFYVSGSAVVQAATEEDAKKLLASSQFSACWLTRIETHLIEKTWNSDFFFVRNQMYSIWFTLLDIHYFICYLLLLNVYFELIINLLYMNSVRTDQVRVKKETKLVG